MHCRFFAKIFVKSGPGGGGLLTGPPTQFVQLPGGSGSGETKVLYSSQSHLINQGKVPMEIKPCNWYLLKVGDEYGLQYTGEDVDKHFLLG